MHSFTVYSVVLVFLLINTNARVIPDNYERERIQLLYEETNNAVGGKLQLSDDENQANDILMKWKHQELDDSLKNPQHYNFSKHYFTYKNDIDKSKVYQIIRRMPKGAALHVHSSLMLNPSVLVKLTYMDHLYGCFVNDSIRFSFSLSIPQRPCPHNGWTLISDIRRVAVSLTGCAKSFDEQLEKYFNIYKENNGTYTNVDINTVWRQFDEVYYVIKSLIAFRPAREVYWYETLKKFYNDNIIYIELRSGLQNLYELDGTKHDKKYMLELYQRITDKFIKAHPDFYGVKFIVTKNRAQSVAIIKEAINHTIMLKKEMPNLIAGFDLVGQEELGKPLTDFLPVLSEARNELDYYLHAGETDWMGTSTDENLVDAILLGSKRIGHGYALTKHPTLLSVVMKNNIALEVNVISNVVLSLVHDVRNHPLASYLAMGLPIVLSSDDPGVWDAEPLSHDFFVAFMGVASKHADLRMLKQLAMNSITYSSLNNDRKVKLMEIFNRRWQQFIKDLIYDKSVDGKHSKNR